MTFPNAYASEVVDYITGRAVATTTAKTTYIAALTADPGVTTALVNMSEDTTPGYARQPVIWTVPAVPLDPEQGDTPESSNVSDVAVGPYTAAMLDGVTHLALVDVASGTAGKIRLVWALDDIFVAGVGDSLLLPAGSIIVGSQG